jgi:hypothetical protein
MKQAFPLLICYVAYFGSCLQTFRGGSISVLFPKEERPKKNAFFFIRGFFSLENVATDRLSRNAGKQLAAYGA